MRQKVIWLAVAALGVALAALANPNDLKGKNAPPIRLKFIDGKDFNSADVEADLAVYDFWASWCGPCRRGLPALQEFAKWAKDNRKSVVVYTVNLREDADKAKQAWRELGLSLPILMDTTGAVTQSYLIEGIPTTVAVSGGKVVEVHVGFSEDYLNILKTWTARHTD